MARRHTVESYEEFGMQHDLFFKGEILPLNTRAPVDWECLFCGRLHNRSLNEIQSHTRSCICRSPRAVNESDYFKVAVRLHLTWMGNRLPKTTTTLTKWRNILEVEFEASYFDLAHNRIPSRLKDYLLLSK